MQRRTATNGPDYLHARALAKGALYINNFVPLAHAQVHGLLRQLVQFTHGRKGCVTHIKTRFNQVTQLQQAHTKAVVASHRPVNKAACSQIIQDAMCCRWVQAGFFCNLFEGHGLFPVGQYLQQGEHALNHLNGWLCR